MTASLGLILSATLVIAPDSATVASRPGESRWIVPATVSSDHRPFRAWLVLARSRAAVDTVDTGVLAPAGSLTWFPESGKECGSTAPAAGVRTTAVVTWRPAAVDTILPVCVVASGEGTAYLAARIMRGRPTTVRAGTILSAPITVGTGNPSPVRSVLLSALLGAAVTFVLFLLQETVKRFQDRRDMTAAKEQERKGKNISLKQSLTELLYGEVRDNAKKLDDYLRDPSAEPPTMRVGATVSVLNNKDLADHLERYAGGGLVSRLTRTYLNARRYNRAVNQLDAIDPSSVADRQAAASGVRQRASELFREFQSAPNEDGVS
jgi:hypothetical protein